MSQGWRVSKVTLRWLGGPVDWGTQLVRLCFKGRKSLCSLFSWYLFALVWQQKKINFLLNFLDIIFRYHCWFFASENMLFVYPNYDVAKMFAKLLKTLGLQQSVLNVICLIILLFVFKPFSHQESWLRFGKQMAVNLQLHLLSFKYFSRKFSQRFMTFQWVHLSSDND